MSPKKSPKGEDYVLKTVVYAVISWWQGNTILERVFDTYTDAVEYIDWQIDERDYTIESVIMIQRGLPF